MEISELLNLEEYGKLLIGLLALVNPLGGVPVFLGLTEQLSKSEKQRTASAAIITASITLVLFTFVGLDLLLAFGISVPAFRVAGGLLLLLIGLSQLGFIELPALSSQPSGGNPRGLGIVPMGIPKLAGPGAITTVILYAEIHEGVEHKILVSAVILTVLFITYLFLRAAASLGNRMGEMPSLILSRVMGLLLAAIAIEFMIDGIADHFPGLVTIHSYLPPL